MAAQRKDPDQIACYCAETAVRTQLEFSSGAAMEVHGTTITIPVELKFGSLDHCQVYVDYVLGHSFVRDRWSTRAAIPVRVRHRQSGNKAHYESHSREGGPAIALHDPKIGQPGWALRSTVLLHEISHHIALGDGHGLQFRRVFLDLVEEFIGPEARWLLSLEFQGQGLLV